MIRRVALDVAMILALAFVGLLCLTAYRVQNICRNAPQACRVVVPQAHSQAPGAPR